MYGRAGKEEPGSRAEITYGNSKPVNPEEVIVRKKEDIPDVVFDVFNELIARHASQSGHSRFLQKEVDKLLKQRGVNLDEAYERHWLDVEGIYSEQGWDVEYDKPGFNETYDASFAFRPMRKNPTA